MRTVATVGVYGFTAESFLAALRDAGVGVLLDVRQRRGVRGVQYAWANSARLQAGLARAGIAYHHVRELAPTTELRRLQSRDDARRGVGPRSRRTLAPEYRNRYTAEILDRVDLPALLERLPVAACAALLCVERDPEACHRSLVAERLATDHGVSVVHLSAANVGGLGHHPPEARRLHVADSVYRVTEVIGTSGESWEAAARNAVETAARTVRDLRIAEVVRKDVVIENGQVAGYRVRLAVSFKYDTGD